MHRRRAGHRDDSRRRHLARRSAAAKPGWTCYLLVFGTLLFPALGWWLTGSPARSQTRKCMAIEKVGVVGCGLMGAGIAQVSAAAGFFTVVREVSPELVDKGLKSIDKNLARLVEKGTIKDTAKTEIRGRLKGTTVIED